MKPYEKLLKEMEIAGFNCKKMEHKEVRLLFNKTFNLNIENGLRSLVIKEMLEFLEKFNKNTKLKNKDERKTSN